MYCRYCGRELQEGADFCLGCGKELVPGKVPVTKKMYEYEIFRLKPPKETKNPGVAASLGFILGWLLLGPVGYIYLGQWNWFWITFVIQIVAYPVTLFVVYPLFPILFAIHQYQMAKDLNEILVLERKGYMMEVEGESGDGTPDEGI